MSSREYRTRLRGNSWKEKLAKDIGTAMSYSGSKDEFIRNMSILGYHMTWTDTRKNITFQCPNGKKCCDDKLHDNKYLKESIESELLQREFPDGEKLPTGWETSRELYEQHIRERALSKTEMQRTEDSYSDISSGLGSLASAVSKIVDNDSEDPDERRKRIEAEENGEALGTIFGKGISLLADAVSDSSVNASAQEPDHDDIIDRQREEILREVFEEDDYEDEDYDDDEDEGFTMTL